MRAETRWQRAIDIALRITACVLLVMLLVSGLHDVCRAWDAWYYHLPFAALLGGILKPDAFVLSRLNQARFDGFPLLGERIQALLWRAAGTPTAANLLAYLSVPLFALFIGRRLRVPFGVICLGLFAVPLVQIHATSAYVDLPANIAVSAAILLAIEAYALERPPDARTCLFACAWAVVAANTKLLMIPIALAVLGAFVVHALRALRRERAAPERRRALRVLLLLALALPVICATPLVNTLRFGNPAYPEQLSVLGRTLPGVDEPYSSSPRYLQNAPRAARFVASVLEFRLAPLASHRRWSIDQWTPTGDPAYRMGGYFGAYVAFELALLIARAFRERERAPRVAGAAFALLTCVVVLMPQCHELRYYLCWMIVLIALNRWLASLPGARGPSARALGVVSVCALGVVLWSTRCTYVYPSGVTFRELVSSEVDPRTIATIGDGERVCSRQAPFALLWAARFHAPHRYVLKEAEEAADCAGYRSLE